MQRRSPEAIRILALQAYQVKGEVVLMAKGKRRGGRRGFRVGKYINIGFKILGGAIALSPAIQAVSAHTSDPQAIPADAAYRYTGLDIQTGAFNSAQAMTGIGTVVVGVLVAKLGSFLGRRF